MSKLKRSITAELAAVARARHLKYESSIVIEDPYAIEMTNAIFRFICNNPLLNTIVFNGLLNSLKPYAAVVLVRAKYVEDRFKQMQQQGIKQYVILGAGLDSFAQRSSNQLKELKIFELDHPESQQYKLKKLKKINAVKQDHVEYIAVDFEQETVASALGRSSFDHTQPALFSMMGVTYFIRPESVRDTLKSIANISVAGSEVVFDYSSTQQGAGNKNLAWHGKFFKCFLSKFGETIKTGFNPACMNELLSNLDYKLLENLSPNELSERYFHGRNDQMRPSRDIYIARCCLT